MKRPTTKAWRRLRDNARAVRRKLVESRAFGAGLEKAGLAALDRLDASLCETDPADGRSYAQALRVIRGGAHA